MQSSEEYAWPPKCRLSFHDGRGQLIMQSSDRDLDLADTLMLSWPHRQRTVQLSLRTLGVKWVLWSDENLRRIEDLVRYDLNFDGYSVSMARLEGAGRSCREEAVWKLVIRGRH
jgi:hypothetical protein